MGKDVLCMKEKLLRHEFLIKILSYDKDNGLFTRNVDIGLKHKKGEIAGGIRRDSKGKEALVITINGYPYYAHRLAWFYVYGDFPACVIDHINGNSLDNRLSNMRSVSVGENNKNLRISKLNKSGVCGVFWRDSVRKFVAVIGINNKKAYLGNFDSLFEAVCARKNAEINYGYHKNHGSYRTL